MALNIRPGSRFPYTIAIPDESILGTTHTWESVADWCTMLIGPMDEWWTIEWQDNQGMVWGFKRREDAGLFRFTWSTTS
jgi:hypothetical protein